MKTNNTRAGIMSLLNFSLLFLLAIFVLTVFEKDNLIYTYVYSISLSVVGLLDIFIASVRVKAFYKPSWILTCGFFLVFMGIFSLYAFYSDEINIAIYFGFFALTCAASQISVSAQLKSLGIVRWWGITVYGIISLIFSILFVIEPFYEYIDVTVFISIFLLIHASSLIYDIFFLYTNRKKAVTEVLEDEQYLK